MEEAQRAFEQFKQDWQGYPGAVAVWENNFQHVEQLFNYGSAVRKVMYTTNAIESVNASFRKVTKKGSFPNEDAVFKILLPANLGTLQEMEFTSPSQLGDNPEPAAH